MKKNNKALLVTLSAVALVVATIFGTMAYFTDQEAVINTFTIGQVDITLDELDTDQDDNKKDNKDYTVDGEIVTRDKANKYHLIPGQSYDKDPTVHIQKGSEDCWVFVKVENGIQDIIEIEAFEKQIADNGWVMREGKNVYAYKEKASANEDLKVFNSFTVKGDEVDSSANGNTVEDGQYDLETYKDKNITVTAYAVQAAGFDTALDAWNAANGQFK